MERLKTYKARLVLFPRKAKAPKSGDASKEDVSGAKEGHVKASKAAFPISNKVVIEEGKVSDFTSEEKAYRKLRDARSEARLVGKREKRAKAKEEEASAAKK